MTSDHDLMPPSRPRPAAKESVFGARLGRSAVVGHVPCPQCNHQIPYALRQVGRDVDCPQCDRRGVPVGQSLADETAGRAHIALPFSVMVMKPPRFTRRTLAISGMLLFALFAVGGALLATTSGARFSEGWLSWKTVSARTGKTPEGTSDVDTSQLELAPPDVTLEVIEALLTREDAQEALVQAQVWLQMLKDHGVADNDPRLVRLQQIIDRLSAQLAPKPLPPPAFLGEFRQALGDLRNALIARDLPAARRALTIAERLFAQHPDELDAFGASLKALRDRFRDLEIELEGREKIRELLLQAERRINDEKPTEAAENIAQAMFLALHTPLSDEEFEQNSGAVKRLEPALRLARGKRAIEEAERFHGENDLESREKQLLVAYDLLPDLPAGQVEDLLARANALAEKTIENPTPSAFGRELVFRDAYEEALQFFGQVDMSQELADRCVEAHRLHVAATTLDGRGVEKVGKLILDTLDFQVKDLLSRSSRSEDVPLGLARARAALDSIVPWQGTPEWKLIDSALRNKSNDVAKVAVAEGRKRAAAGDLAGAVRLLEPATKLAGPDLRPQAEALLRGWQVELAALARAEAEQASLNVLREYLQNDKMLLEAWYGLQQFEEQFPDSEYLTRFPAIRQGLRPRVDAAVARAFALLDDYQTRSNWPAYRYVAEKIASAPLSADSQQRFALVQDQIQRLTVEADRRFSATLDLRRGYLGNESSIVKLLQELPLILRLNPDHREAEQFLEKVRAQAQKRAQALLLSARSKMRLTNKGLARRELLRVTRLDPGGDLGKKAAELLRQIDAQEAQ